MKNERLKQLMDFFETNPKDSFILFAIAHEYQSMDDFQNADLWFHQLFQLDPLYLGLYLHWARVKSSLGRKNEALELLSQGQSIAQSNQDSKTWGELETEKFLLDD
jgi:tetratricopeptide (TPR) repeat protein